MRKSVLTLLVLFMVLLVQTTFVWSADLGSAKLFERDFTIQLINDKVFLHVVPYRLDDKTSEILISAELKNRSAFDPQIYIPSKEYFAKKFKNHKILLVSPSPQGFYLFIYYQ